MKPTLKFITIPLSFFSSPDLSVNAKFVAVAIDMYTDSPDGVAMGMKAIQTATNLSAKEVKDALLELKGKGAIEVNMGENGEKLIKPFLYKDRYNPAGAKPIDGDKPTDAETLDWDEIASKWNESCPQLPPVSRWTPNRKRRLKSSLKQADMNCKDLYKVFAIVGATPFLCGNNDKGWFAGFDWVAGNATHLTKIYEGSYSHGVADRRAYEAIMNGGKANGTEKKDDIYR